MRSAKTNRALAVAAVAAALATAGCGMKKYGREIDTSGMTTRQIEEAIADTASRWRNRDWSRANILCKNFGPRPQLVDALAERPDCEFDKDEIRMIRTCGVQEGASEVLLWLSWGAPAERNPLVADGDRREEQWVYYGPYRASRRQYFYVTDGVIDHWETGR